jgi:hypothetical protein
MVSLAARLDQALRAANIAITGVSLGEYDNKATWKVRPANLQAAAQPIIDAFVIPTPAQIADEEAQTDTNRKELQAVALALWECIPAPTMTKVQLRNRIIALYKTL